MPAATREEVRTSIVMSFSRRLKFSVHMFCFKSV